MLPWVSNRDLHGACPVVCLPIWECGDMGWSCTAARYKLYSTYVAMVGC